MAGIALLWVAAVLTLWTGYDYLKAGVKHAMSH
jgi:phosphatidylglycerophosphate synthase